MRVTRPRKLLNILDDRYRPCRFYWKCYWQADYHYSNLNMWGNSDHNCGPNYISRFFYSAVFWDVMLYSLVEFICSLLGQAWRQRQYTFELLVDHNEDVSGDKPCECGILEIVTISIIGRCDECFREREAERGKNYSRTASGNEKSWNGERLHYRVRKIILSDGCQA